MLRVSTLMAAILGTAAATWAQSPSTTNPGSTPPAGPAAVPGAQTSSPYWNGQPQAQASDLPAKDIRNVPVAHANAVRAQLSFNQTLFDLNNAVRLVQMQMDRDPAYVKALSDEKAAYDDMEKARATVLATLTSNAGYNGAATLHKNLTDQIADEQFTDKPDATKLTAMARLKLQYVKDNRKLERDALDRDQAFQDARKKYVEAAARVAQFRDAQALAVAQNDGLAELRKRVGEARIDKSVASVFWTESVDARNIALDYARFYRSVDRYHGYGNGYSPYGTYGGFGGGFGYGGSGFGYPY